MGIAVHDSRAQSDNTMTLNQWTGIFFLTGIAVPFVAGFISSLLGPWWGALLVLIGHAVAVMVGFIAGGLASATISTDTEESKKPEDQDTTVMSTMN